MISPTLVDTDAVALLHSAEKVRAILTFRQPSSRPLRGYETCSSVLVAQHRHSVCTAVVPVYSDVTIDAGVLLR